MKKIVYIHGLGGAKEQSGTYKALKENIKNINLLSPEVPHNPLEAIKWIKEYLDTEKPDLVIAASLGAFYTLFNNEDYKTLVINPAMYGYYDLMNCFGMNYKGEFKPGRSDGKTEFILDEKYYNELIDITDDYLKILHNKKVNIKKIRGVFGTQDELFHHKDDYEKNYNDKYVMIDDYHSISCSSVINYVIPYVKELLEIGD